MIGVKEEDIEKVREVCEVKEEEIDIDIMREVCGVKEEEIDIVREVCGVKEEEIEKVMKGHDGNERGAYRYSEGVVWSER